jgi:predicted membrane protein
MRRRKNNDPARRGAGDNDLHLDEALQGLEELCPNCGSWQHESCDENDVRVHVFGLGGRSGKRGFGGAILGICVLAVGVILLLDNLGIMEAEDVIDFWPMLLVLVGISHFLRPKGSRRWLAGSLFIFAGVIIQLSNFGYLRFDPFDLWPVLLVIAGISLILKPFRKRGATIGEDTSVFEATAILGGTSRRLSAADFQGGDAVAIMGGCEIDLRDCGSEGGPAEIDTFTFWGGIEIKVPEDWEVQVKGVAILGGYGDETRTIEGDGHKVLVVTGVAIMGGVEIKN